ncbi:hypothetical protein IOM36_001644 [Salmonella enterica]|nr:hypothetical protein [Salmonella enterica]
MSLKSILIVSIHLLAALCTVLVIAFYFGTGVSKFVIYLTLFTGALWVTLLYFSITGKKKIQRIVKSVFADNNSVISHFGPYSLRYVGIDTNTGNILLIALDKFRPQVLGFNYNDWAGYEKKGCLLILKFNDLNTPSFQINSNATVNHFVDKLDFLLSSSYKPSTDYSKQFGKIVTEKLQTA